MAADLGHAALHYLFMSSFLPHNSKKYSTVHLQSESVQIKVFETMENANLYTASRREKQSLKAAVVKGNISLINFDLKVLSSHSNWGVRLHSFDPLLKSRCPAIFYNFF